MIVNLIGPPGVGKSTVIELILKQLPRAKHHSIDGFRLISSIIEKGESPEEIESTAWKLLSNNILLSTLVFVETSGLGWRIKKWFSGKTKTTYGRTIKTIILTAPPLVCLDRLEKRDKEEIPFPYGGLTIEALVGKCIDQLPGLYPHAIVIDTDKLNAQEVCDEIIRELKKK